MEIENYIRVKYKSSRLCFAAESSSRANLRSLSHFLAKVSLLLLLQHKTRQLRIIFESDSNLFLFCKNMKKDSDIFYPINFVLIKIKFCNLLLEITGLIGKI